MNCKKEVYGQFAFYPCSRKATTEAGYCKQHDPALLKDRREKSYAKWQARHEEESRVRRIKEAAPDLLAELKHLILLFEPLERDGRLNVSGLATLNGARAAIAKAEGK